MPHGIIVFGASGSGTTTLAGELSKLLGFTHLDLDDYFWVESEVPFTVKRPPEERIAKLQADTADYPGFVMSGSICEWDEPFLPLFDLAVFVTTPTVIRIGRLQQRELERFGDRILVGGDMYNNHCEFVDWAATYDDAGIDQRSRALHEAWLDTLTCPVLRVDGTADLHKAAKDIAASLTLGLDHRYRHGNRWR